jgi:riboflavin kinase/FMN adenylyltransferase
VVGDKLGRMLGFPTANIEIDTAYKLILVDAIYAVTVVHEHSRYGGMLYIGNRPTVHGIKRNIEVNIFNFDKEIYGESLTIFFHQLIRSDRKFRDLEDLKSQLHQDEAIALRILADSRQ